MSSQDLQPVQKAFLLSEEEDEHQFKREEELSKKDGLSKKEKPKLSPSKTIKSILRLSMYSSNSATLDSISPKRTRASPSKEVISPNKSKIGEFFKPKMNLSKSSFTTTYSNSSIPKLISASVISGHHEQKRITLDDFADTSTESSKYSHYDEESINAILKEYEEENERKGFLFKEEFDETKLSDNSKNSRNEIMIDETKDSLGRTNTQKSSIRNKARDSLIELTLDDTKLNSSSSSSPHTSSESPGSSKFEIYEDNQNANKETSNRRGRSNKHRKKVLSTSSNIDVGNRSSLYNSTIASNNTQKTEEGKIKGKYPDPNISLSGTAHGISNTLLDADAENSSVRMSYSGQSILERPLDTVIIDESVDMNETILKGVGEDNNSSAYQFVPIRERYTRDGASGSKARESLQISLSSGELLSRLETFQEIPEQDDTQNTESRNIESTTYGENMEEISTRNREYEKLTSSDELLIANKEVQRRVSVRKIFIETKKPVKSQLPQQAHLPLSDIVEQGLRKNLTLSEKQHSNTSSHPSPPISNTKQFIDKELNQNIDDFRHNKPWTLASPNLSVSKPKSNIRLLDNLTKKNSHDYLLEDAPKPSYLEPVSLGSIYTSGDIEKQLKQEKLPGPSYYSWLTLIGFMLLALVIPPLFFLLSLGFCDNFNHHPCHYYGNKPWLQYLSNYLVNNTTRFSRTQKLFSFVVGVLWIAIVISMIVVGLCVGIASVS